MKGMRYACYAGIGTISLCILTGLYLFIVSSLLIITRCTFLFDSSLAKNIKQSIITISNNQFLKKSFLQAKPAIIQQYFPIITAVQLRYQDNGSMLCRVKAIDPQLIINDSFCLGINGQLYDKNIFSSKTLRTIPSITIQSTEKIESCPYFKDYITKMPLHFFEYFTITWIDHTRIILHDKLSPNHTLLAHYQTDFDDQLLHYYNMAKQAAPKKRALKKQWVVDVRFKNQIIVAQKNMESL